MDWSWVNPNLIDLMHASCSLISTYVVRSFNELVFDWLKFMIPDEISS